jgi:HSP20 family protein
MNRIDRAAAPMTLWARPAWNADRWMREILGPGPRKGFVDEWLKPLAPATEGTFYPAAEITKDGDDAVVRVELPGMDVDKDVNVEVADGQLVIHGERRDERDQESDEDGVRRTLREVRYGAFRRSFALPEHITGENITASYDAGMLTVRVAGVHKNPEVPAARRIAIENKETSK